MTNFSTNQVMQFYVADASTITTKGTDGKISAIKTIPGRGKVATFNNYAEPKKSDIIENILWAKVTKADAFATPLKRIKVIFENHTPIKGETYIVRVSFPEIPGAGVESWATKAVAVESKGEDNDSMVREFVEKLTKVLPEYIEASITGNGIQITANPTALAYKRGFRPMVVPDFNVSINQVVSEGELVTWGKFYTEASGTLSGDYKLADMEYFALGERGDEYRQMGWPDVVYEPEYKVEVGTEYNVLVVHYGYKGANDQSHLSEKDLIIASTASVSDLAAFAKALGAEKVSTVVDAEAGQKAETEA